MGNYEEIKAAVANVIKANGNKEITGEVMQNVLLSVINSLGAGAIFAGIATPATNPGTPDGPVFYLASESGTYTNFNAIELQDGLSVLMWNGSWSSQQIFGIDDVPTLNSNNLVKSGGVFSEVYSKYFITITEEAISQIQDFYLCNLSQNTNYYLRYYISFIGRKMFQVFNSSTEVTAATVVAEGEIFDNGFCSLDQRNNSGIYGFIQVKSISALPSSTSYNLSQINKESVSNKNLLTSQIPYFLKNRFRYSNYIKEIYLEGIDQSLSYTLHIYKGTRISVQILNSSGTIIAQAQPYGHNTISRFISHNGSSVTGWLYCLDPENSFTNLDSLDVEINNVGVSMLGYSKNINYFLNRPILNNTTDSIIEELFLKGLSDNTDYYLRGISISSSSNYIQIFNSEVASSENLVAEGKIWENQFSKFIYIYSKNNSGIYGVAYVSDNILSRITSDDAVFMINKSHVSEILNSPNISDAKSCGEITRYVADTNLEKFEFVKELYLKGLDPTKEYTIRTYSGTSAKLLQIWSADNENIYAEGTIVPGQIMVMDTKNNSGIYGYAKIDDSLVVSEVETTRFYYINNNIVSDDIYSPIISKFLSNKFIRVKKGGTEDIKTKTYTSLSKAILDNYGIWDLHILIDEGEYDLISELTSYYGTSNFLSLTPQGRGIELNCNITIEGCPNAIIKADYTGSDENMQREFSPLNLGYGNGGATLIGINIKCSRTRYCVHDEKLGGAGGYTNIYDNCNFYINNTNNSYWHSSQCIGGGLGKSGNIIIRNSIFESVDPAYSGADAPAVSYHNAVVADAKSQLSLVNNYIKGNRGFRFGWYGSSTKMTEIILSGNCVGMATMFRAERGQDFPNRNMELYEWNTTIRS